MRSEHPGKQLKMSEKNTWGQPENLGNGCLNLKSANRSSSVCLDKKGWNMILKITSLNDGLS